MTPQQVVALAESGESETLEFKTTTGTRREAVATVCAMLNQRGGHVLFGVSPDGSVVGQQVSERTLEELGSEIQRIDPPVFPEVERVRLSGSRELVVIHVERGASSPYQYRGASYRRVGNTTRAMLVEEYNRMLFERMHGDRRWETEPAAGWALEDLDLPELRNAVAEAVRVGRLNEPGSREPEDMLLGLGLMRDGLLLRAAAVLFGKARRLESEMPQCLLRVARFRGIDRSDFLDNRQFYGNAFALLSSAERFLNDTIPVASRFEPGRVQRIDEPLYPLLAVREAVANALCHRDYAMGGGSIGLAVYDDRLEVTSTGPLHFGLTPKDLFAPHESRPWNPLIARTFYRRGIIEQWGRGTLRMVELATSAGLPRPEIEELADSVTVRFRRPGHQAARGSAADLTDQQNAVLELLQGSGRALALREIRASLGPNTDQRRLRGDLATLKAKRLADSEGRGAGARWKPS